MKNIKKLIKANLEPEISGKVYIFFLDQLPLIIDAIEEDNKTPIEKLIDIMEEDSEVWNDDGSISTQYDLEKIFTSNKKEIIKLLEEL